MNDDRKLNMLIVRQLGDVNRLTGEFVAGILDGSISKEDQIAFATKLTDLAGFIKQRATGEVERGSVIEGEVQDDCGTSSAGSADHPDS
ncbi:hypothetical protein [Amycolatopsis rifamycinica]|uniref:hypothetical protein n=1 Tax=Amycolatopsis rifamycinica TaxID=287986 RepID=UPI0009FE2ED6|nr:hypothetical protein [Amycolatopsis rifamycinica]